MSDFYIYASRYKKKNEQTENINVSVTVLFCPSGSINLLNVQSEIKNFYENNYQTDEILVLGAEYLKEQLEDIFISKQLETFKYIPHIENEHLANNLHLGVFDKDGKVRIVAKKSKSQFSKRCENEVINDGLVQIFNKRGGLIEAVGDAHHFVFPSGKHCDKFLRTGNILTNTAEIYFIAFKLLSVFNEKTHKKIYCDTSSINTLAVSLLALKRSFLQNLDSIPIESFSSYEGLFSRKVRFYDNSLILISSSTSGNILERIIEHDADVDVDNVSILFFLGSVKDFSSRRKSIICNLTHSLDNPNGISYYQTYTEKDCPLCKSGSYPVEVKGDVFLLEKPKINRLTIKVSDAPKKLADFVKQFRADKRATNNVLKVNYKETSKSQYKYEVYFDIHLVLESIQKGDSLKYSKFKTKLYDYINQYIPSNTKYLITLPDEGSTKLAEIILKEIENNYLKDRLPQIVPFNDVNTQITDENLIGSAVIVASCVSNGKNLLYLSRALRNFERLKLVYFVGLARTSNSLDFDFLKSNLKQGHYGKETNSFIEVESFFCNGDSKNTTWLAERDFIENELLEIAEEQSFVVAQNVLKGRIKNIDNSLSSRIKGLGNELFYRNTTGQELILRKGFAFINFDKNINDISQADVYFTISTIINELRNSNIRDHCLKQSEYVRNIIDPGNFNRFNDGIIQACLLRAAKPCELSYHMDASLSGDMKIILEKIIESNNSAQGEGLIEFLFAIAIKKLTLKKDDLIELISKSMEIDQELVKTLSIYIKKNMLQVKESLEDKVIRLETENENLKNQFCATDK